VKSEDGLHKDFIVFDHSELAAGLAFCDFKAFAQVRNFGRKAAILEAGLLVTLFLFVNIALQLGNFGQTASAEPKLCLHHDEQAR
jgi:hypothetical protein